MKEMNRLRLNFLKLIMVLTCFFSYSTQIYSQQYVADEEIGKLKTFVGEWGLKDDKWITSFDGNYNEDINPNISFIASEAGTENTLLWICDFDGSFATLLWAYHKETKNINHISNTSANDIGVGMGKLDDNNDVRIKIEYPNRCKNCNRRYIYHWISKNEIEFKATFYEDELATGDFYGGTLIRKIE